MHREGRLAARPHPPGTLAASPPGDHALRLDATRDALVHVPPDLDRARAAPLAVVLHGAGGSAAGALPMLRDAADAQGMLVVAPSSRRSTWDAIVGGLGPDVAQVDAALAWVFDRYPVDPSRIAIAGFSDGASYALVLGLANGDLFTHVLAFSPGFSAPPQRNGRPVLYVSHGTRDAVLPIDRCSRRIVPVLEREGYAVRYVEFDGPHVVPQEIAREALDLFLGWPR
jgi:predicted esterase